MKRLTKFCIAVLLLETVVLSGTVYYTYLLHFEFVLRLKDEKFLLLELVNLIQTTENVSLYLELCNIPLSKEDLVFSERLKYFYNFDAKIANLLVRYCKHIDSVVPRVTDVTPHTSIDPYVYNWQFSVVLEQIDALFNDFFFIKEFE